MRWYKNKLDENKHTSVCCVPKIIALLQCVSAFRWWTSQPSLSYGALTRGVAAGELLEIWTSKGAFDLVLGYW